MSEFAKTQATPVGATSGQAAAQAGIHSARPTSSRPNSVSAAPPPYVPPEPAALRAQLATLELLRGMGPELLDALVARCPLRTLPAGSTLLAAGQTNSEIFVVLSGELNVHLDGKRDAPVAVLHSGDTVGELSALDKKPTSASVAAHTDSLLLCIDETMFWHIIQASHGFAVRLMFKLAERLRANNTTVQANMELCAHFEAVALSDALTGVHSRRWLDETLPRLCDRHRFDGKPVTIAVVDIDHFKNFNDQYGHQSGDIALIEVAKTMRNRLRPTDFIARFGGEEFVLIFPQTPLAGAAVAAERLREAVRAAPIQTRDGQQLPSATVSIGLAELRPGQDIAGLLRLADEALYRAKRNGRNRVEVHNP
jgi:diguanylate cyclase (GGDEF)-like protein